MKKTLLVFQGSNFGTGPDLYSTYEWAGLEPVEGMTFYDRLYRGEMLLVDGLHVRPPDTPRSDHGGTRDVVYVAACRHTQKAKALHKALLAAGWKKF